MGGGPCVPPLHGDTKMSLTEAYRELESGAWATHHPSDCPCRGRGWIASDLDTWHRCPIHGRGVPHPEDEESEFDMEAHLLRVRREAWAAFRTRSGLPERVFRARVVATNGGVPTSPNGWLDAAQAFIAGVLNERARSAGFSCRLEAAWSCGEDGGGEWYAD